MTIFYSAQGFEWVLYLWEDCVLKSDVMKVRFVFGLKNEIVTMVAINMSVDDRGGGES